MMRTKTRVATAISAALLSIALGVGFATLPPAVATAASSSSTSSANYTAHTWSYSKYPLYYKARGKANTSKKVDKGKVKTAKLDSHGRAGTVVAKVTYNMVKESAGWREELGPDTDSIAGWGNQARVNVKLSNGTTYYGYGWNKSHLLADSLGGHAVRRNLICGTRMQNVGNNDSAKPGGMAYTETLARNYLYSHHKGWVYYRVTPVYKDSELVPRSVYVDIKSNDGSINQHVEVFNAMRGYTINYKKGTLTAKAATSSSSSKLTHVWITSTGKRYHKKSCAYLTASKRKVTLKAAKQQGLTPCLSCIG